MRRTEQYQEAIDRQFAFRRNAMGKAMRKLEMTSVPGNAEGVYACLAELSRCQELLCSEYRYDLRQLHHQLEGEGLEPCYHPLIYANDVCIESKDGIFRIILDSLLPFPTRGSVFYVHERLESALRRHGRRNGHTKPFGDRRCAVVFLHHYDRERSGKRKLRDFDNMERRCILNVLSRHMVVGDSPDSIVTMDLMTGDQRDYSEICIMPMERFTSYILTPEITGNLSK